MRFNELVQLLERHGFTLVKEKGSIRYYGKPAVTGLIRIDYHGAQKGADRHVPGDPEDSRAEGVRA
jgi:predicted RNA binding protein YcfA (HicA-like mRNA interferase family)